MSIECFQDKDKIPTNTLSLTRFGDGIEDIQIVLYHIPPIFRLRGIPRNLFLC